MGLRKLVHVLGLVQSHLDGVPSRKALFYAKEVFFEAADVPRCLRTTLHKLVHEPVQACT